MSPTTRSPLERTVVLGGGLVFAAALAFCARFLMVTLGRAEGATGRAALVALAADTTLFGAFAVHHSLFARGAVKGVLEHWLPRPLLRSGYVWAASGLLVVACAAWQPVGGIAYEASAPLSWLLRGVQVAGLLLVAASARVVGIGELSGVREADPAGAPPELRVAGPYRWLRHPIYLGWILAVAGFPRMTVNRLAFALISTAYLIVAMPWEEQSLEGVFGAVYRDYKTRVKWRVLPYVY